MKNTTRQKRCGIRSIEPGKRGRRMNYEIRCAGENPIAGASLEWLEKQLAGLKPNGK